MGSLRETRRWTLRLARLVVAVLIVVALVAQFRAGATREGFSAINFASYFTVLSNVAAALMLAWLAARGERASDALRGAATLYMGLTGVVYAVLLAPESADVGLTLPWVDAVVHEIAPIAVVLDWFADPPRRHLPRSALGAWLAFPALYLLYSLVRGPVADWYPYPFLDPGASGGYAGVAAYSAAVLVVIVAIGSMLRWWAGRPRSAET